MRKSGHRKWLRCKVSSLLFFLSPRRFRSSQEYSNSNCATMRLSHYLHRCLGPGNGVCLKLSCVSQHCQHEWKNMDSKLLEDFLQNEPTKAAQYGTDVMPSRDYHIKAATAHAASPHRPRDPSESTTSALTQLLATVKRQMIQKFRMPFSMLLEILLPIVFVLGLVGGNLAAGTTTQPAMNYLLPLATLNATTTPLAYSASTTIKQLFCYNGTQLDATQAAAGVYGGNCADGLLRCMNGNSLSKFCSSPIRCTDDYQSFRIPRGFCFYTQSLPFLASNRYSSRNVVPIVPLDFDAFVLSQWAGLIGHNGPITDPFGVNDVSLMAGPINFSPDTPQTRSFVGLLNKTVALFPLVVGKMFATMDEGSTYLSSLQGEGNWGLIDIAQADTTALNYVIRLNRTAVPSTTNVRARFSGGLASTGFVNYINSGFVTLQSTLNNVYLKNFLNITDRDESPAVVAPMPYAEYRQSVFLSIAGSALAPLTLVLSYLYTVSQLSKRLVEEKELRLREGTMVMGLGKFAFYFSWIITYSLQMLVSSILITICVKSALIKQSDPIIIFLLYFLFSLSTVLLSALLSSFFSKSRITALVVPLIYFGLSIPSFSLPEGTGRGTYTLLSLFSPTAFGIGTRLLFSYEVNDGMGWGQVGSTLDTVNMGSVFALFIFDCILYFALTIYFDAVLPSEWGTRSHPCCCCMCCCTTDNDAAAVGVVLSATGPIPSVGREGNAMEEYPTGSSYRDGCTVHLQSLRKEFPTDDVVKVAVDDFDLKIFPDQITVLLGHNGAGKTTTMSMITGMLGITRGDCIVYGKSVKRELRAVRQEIGYCPQHNILWNGLSCAEHLRYFAALKGVSSDNIEGQVDEMLTKVDLMDKKDVYSEMLSGGQKRKLSVAIAFIGGSRLVLLDEPTAGMDVAARRHTWDLLKEMSAGRTIILTTHYMDEADLLGNRIAIMSRGSLHSYGSPMFLKARLGTGYLLKVSVEGGASAQADAVAKSLLQTIRNSVPDASVKEAKGQEIAFSLPMKAAPSFGRALASLEDRSLRATHRITGVSMSVATLEDIFVKIAEEEEMGGPGHPPSPTNSSSSHESVLLLEGVYDKLAANPCEVGFGQQFVGLLWKRFHNARRDRRTIVLQVVLPVVCILLAMLMSKLGPPDAKLITLNGNLYSPTPQQIPFTGSSCLNLSASFDKYSSSLYIPSSSLGQSYNFSETLLGQFKRHGNDERFVAVSCNDPEYWQNFTYATSSGLATYARSAGTVLLFNATAVHSLPQAVNMYHSSIAGTYYGRSASITVGSYPLPFSARQSATISGVQNLVIGIFILIPFTLIPSTYVAWVVKERSSKAKHLQMVSGVNYFAYWTANFIFDIVSFLLTELLALIIFAIFKRDEYIGSGAIGGTILIFVMYGLSGVVSAYLFSFLFDNFGTAQNITMLANFLCGFALVITMYILQVIDSVASLATALAYVCRLVPAYCLGDGILVLASVLVAGQTGATINIWAMDQLGADLLFMAGETIVFSMFVLLIDHPQRQLRKQQLLFDRNAEAPPVDEEDADVKSERREVEEYAVLPTHPRHSDVVTVRKLRKVYDNGKVAVQNISFGVKRGEVFGFLGTNGAGKTTTMSILTAEFLPSMGHCSVGGFDVVEDAGEARRIMGYCPQFDALIDLMTCEEHLQLYAALRGVNRNDKDFVVDSLLKACGIEQYRSVPSKKLSGGNKRKLSVAISLIGAPKLVLLDEPSAGMDPHARRQLWDVIVFVAKKSSVVLTTHHLEEVDVLAHRVGIMVDGTLRCLGTLDHLKTTFGSGYELNIKTPLRSVDGDANEEKMEQDGDEVIRFLERTFPSVSLIERRQQKLTFTLSSRGVQLSQVFQILQNAKDTASAPIEEYTVQQASLEQVFLRISEGASAESIRTSSTEGERFAAQHHFPSFATPSPPPMMRAEGSFSNAGGRREPDFLSLL